MTLPYDFARCEGSRDGEGWHKECEDCLRRTSPGHPGGWQTVMMPPTIFEFKCEFYIQPVK